MAFGFDFLRRAQSERRLAAGDEYKRSRRDKV